VTQPEPTVDPDLPPGARQRLFSPVTATLICGHRDAILVDALLTLDQARRLAGWIAAHGKNLTSVYITHAHGDHWFGLSAILDRYPAARALTLPAALDQMHRLNTLEIVAAFWPDFRRS
jgi:glyoxylase-like metal-dependent hydrolase (beta-lactamase superfamily II)